MGRLPTIRRAVTIGAVLAAVLASPAAAAREQDSGLPSLEIETVPLHAPLHIGLSTAPSVGLPSRIEVDVPSGYSLALTDARGTEVADATVALFDTSGASFAGVVLAVDDPAAYSSDANAQACAPGAHAALWSGKAGVAGQTLRMLVFVDPAQNGGDSLVVCFSGLAGTAQITTDLDMIVGTRLTSPTAKGTYTWRALVTPRSGETYELRALAIRPSSLSLKATHDTKRNQVVLSGRATAGGQPLGHRPISVDVQVGNVLIGSDGSGGPKTGASGRFTVRTRVAQTSDYIVTVGNSPEARAAPSTAPGGCLSQTIVPPAPAYATVFVSRNADPRRAYTSSGQHRAAAELPRAADLPAGAAAAAPGTHVCDTRHASEKKLTINGEAQSPLFVSGTFSVLGDPSKMQAVEPSTTTRVYHTRADAKAALAAEARTTYARCAFEGATGTVKASNKGFPRHPATVRAFHGRVGVLGPNGSVELVYVERGRSLARIVATGVGMDARPVTLSLVRKLSARLR